MDFNKIDDLISELESIRINRKYSWTLCVYGFQKETNKKNYFIWVHKFHMEKGMDEYVDTMINKLKNKLINLDPEISLYENGEESKKTLTKLRIDDEVVSDNYRVFNDAIDKASTGELGDSSYKGILLIGKLEGDFKNEKRIYLLNRHNPINKVAKRLYWCMKTNELKQVKNDDRHVLDMNENVDCFVYRNFIYSLDLKMEEIFDLERTRKIIINNNINIIRSKPYFNDYFINYIEKLKSSEKNPLYNMSIELLNELDDKDNLNNFCITNEVKLVEGKIDIKTDEEAQKYYLFLTRRLANGANNTMINGKSLKVEKHIKSSGK